MRRAGLALLALVTLPAMAKSLYWRSLDVTANLDKEGALHVIERQAIVFDGDWNGGERTFRRGIGQGISFESLSRVDGGVERPLTRGNLAEVDHYDFTSADVLRWRSRLPNDPPFSNQEITYVLRYAITGVLRESDGVYDLNHDFAFPDRAGKIEHFTLRFDIDPAWHGAQSPINIERTNLAPGQSVVVSRRLEYASSGQPFSAVHAPSQKAARAVAIIFVIVLALLILDFVFAEKEKGRFAALTPTTEIDDAWLETHVFSLPPEAAGALMRGKTGAAQVAAILARMTQEGKLRTHVEERRNLLTIRQVLCMELLADRDNLSPTERKLVNGLFVKGSKTTDTDAIRKYYRNRGFNPAAIVEQGNKSLLQRYQPPKRAFGWKIAGAIAVSALLLILAAFGGDNNVGVVFFAFFVGIFVVIAASLAAAFNAEALDHLPARFALVALFLAPIVLLAWWYTLGSARLMMHLLTPIALCAFAASMVRLALTLLRSAETPDTIAERKRLYSARRYFIAELRSATPRLRDDWYPYFLTFGLGRHVERWFGAFGAASAASTGLTSSSFSSGSSSATSSSPSFTGGGGAFGGAGASGGWAIAAAAIGAGVASPSSSSGGGSSGGSSSSGSSGGGGGGGW